MRDLKLFLSFITLFCLAVLFQGCTAFTGAVGGEPINYHDGTWSSCTYTQSNGRTITPPPVQLGGAPMEWTEPDGTGVKCVPIPKATMPEPVLTPEVSVQCRTCHQPELIALE